jgi:hypothetical protein
MHDGEPRNLSQKEGQEDQETSEQLKWVPFSAFNIFPVLLAFLMALCFLAI